MKKKSIISIVLVLSIIASLFTISAISTSAASISKPSVVATNKDNGIRVSWNKVSGATSYIVYFREANARRWSQSKVLSSSTTAYPCLYVQSQKQYKFQVKAIGRNTYAFSKVITLNCWLKQLKGKNAEKGYHHVYWSKLQNAKSYTLIRFADNGKYTVIYNGKNNYFNDKTELEGYYKYQVQTHFNNGYSGWSATQTMVWGKTQREAEDYTYNYLRNYDFNGKKLNKAAVCGIMGHIKAECDFNPRNYFKIIVPKTRFELACKGWAGILLWCIHDDGFSNLTAMTNWNHKLSVQLQFLCYQISQQNMYNELQKTNDLAGTERAVVSFDVFLTGINEYYKHRNDAQIRKEYLKSYQVAYATMYFNRYK